MIIAARLKGGSTVHAMMLNENGKITSNQAAVCGRKPGANRSWMQRSGWFPYKPGTVKVNCPDCLAKGAEASA